jgi:hypothetical protein
MRETALSVAQELGVVFEEVDVDADPETARRYDLEVPVLCVNGVKAFSIRVTPALLHARLAREGR